MIHNKHLPLAGLNPEPLAFSPEREPLDKTVDNTTFSIRPDYRNETVVRHEARVPGWIPGGDN